MCGCIGYHGSRPGTHVDVDGVERCDDCSMQRRAAYLRDDDVVRRAALAFLMSGCLIAGLAMVATSGRTRTRDGSDGGSA